MHFPSGVALEDYHTKWTGFQPKNPVRLLVSLGVESFMLAAGFFLMGLYPIASIVLVASSFYLMFKTLNRTIKWLSSETMQDCIGRLFGKKEWIERLPVYDSQSVEKKGIMRTVGTDQITRSVIFFFDIIKEEKQSPNRIQKKNHRWVFLLSSSNPIKIIKEDREVHVKNKMTDAKAAFLRHLIEYKGRLTQNSEGISYQMENMDWSLLEN